MESEANTTVIPNEHDLAYREGENANPKSQERTDKEATGNESNLHCDSCGQEGNENNDGTSVNQLPSIKTQQVNLCEYILLIFTEHQRIRDANISEV